MIGQHLPPRTFGPLTMTDIVRYQGASGDLNPMHHDDDLARGAGYRAAFGVGMLNAGYLAAYCTDHFGTDSVRRFRTRFRKVVYRGAVLTAQGVITRVVEVSGQQRLEVQLTMTDAEGDIVVEGVAEFAGDLAGGAAMGRS